MEKPTKIAIADVLKLREAAEQRPAPECAEVSRQRAIMMMAPSLIAMHDRGHTWPAIVKWLGEQGVHITTTTLHKVLRQAALQQDADPESSRERTPGRAPPAPTNKPPRGARRDAPPADRPAPPKTAAKATRPPSSRPAVPPSSPGTPASPRDPSSETSSQTPAVPNGTFVMRPDTPNL